MAEVVRRRYSRILLEGREIGPDLSECNQEAVEDAVKRVESLGKIETGSLGKLETGSLGQLETGSPGKLETRSSDQPQTDSLDQPETRSVDRPRVGERLVRLPDLIVVDGGKGQLNSACRELQRLGLTDRPVIGLAKEFEEIYPPGRPLPLRLPEDSGAFQLLHSIRDEAHRVATSYHQLLMKKRIAESSIGESPGVSDNREKA